MNIHNIFKRRVEAMDWQEFHDYMQELTINQFQQQTREANIRNTGHAIKPSDRERSKQTLEQWRKQQNERVMIL